MSHWKYILCLYFLLNSTKGSLFSEYYNISFSEYYVTSTVLTLNNINNIERDVKSLCCEIQFEKDVIYKMVLKIKNIEVVNSKSKFILCGEAAEDCITYDDKKYKNFEVIEGSIPIAPNASVSGYLQNSCFYGTVFVNNIIYYVQELKHYPEVHHRFRTSGHNAVIIKENLSNPLAQSQVRIKGAPYILSNSDREEFRKLIGQGKVCTLFILVDNTYLTTIHNRDVKAAVAQILNTLEDSNALFRTTDFDEDGYPDNIGFMIKYFTVLQSEESRMNLLPKQSKSSIDASLYLKSFSQYTLLNEVCLGIAFSGQIFDENVLGISYTAETNLKSHFKYPIGGICDRPYKFQAGKNLNTMAVSPRLKTGRIVPQFIFELTLAHELGHSFGSKHDISSDCSGHLMAPQTPQRNYRKHFTFSSCSKESILKTIIRKGHCFDNYDRPFCGNGIVEGQEDCDCGTVRECITLDACCIPMGNGKDSCKVKKNVDCHPSQGICCTSKCKYNDLSDFGLDCRNFEKKCPCKGSEPCRCGVQSTCINNTCSSEECTRLSLVECKCPANITNNKCKTCCLVNGSCLPSHAASEKVISNNKSLITSIKPNKAKSESFGHYKSFCFNKTCVELYFRETNPTEYCVIHGQVGICNKNFQCSMHKPRRIFPNLEVYNESSSSTVYMSFPLLLVISLSIFV